MVDEFAERKLQLFSISPQSVSNNQALIKKLRLNFEILHDQENTFARKLDLVHGFSSELKSIYLELGANLAEVNGEPSWTLPIPTQIIVGQDLKIVSIQYDADYRNRPEPTEILQLV